MALQPYIILIYFIVFTILVAHVSALKNKLAKQQLLRTSYRSSSTNNNFL